MQRDGRPDPTVCGNQLHCRSTILLTRDGLYGTLQRHSLELIFLSSVNKVSLV